MSSSTLPPLIAIVGCDGSGKSTITEALQQWLSKSHPTRTCHLGKQSGNMGRALAKFPLFGARLEQSIQKKAKVAQSSAGPSAVTAMGIYAFTLRRERRFKRMMRLRSAGNLILADRFPQIDMAGAMDGPGLNNAKSTGLQAWLAKKEQRKFRAMVAHHPDLILRLNVSLDIAAARKPDHIRSSLARKIDELSRLRFGGAPLIEINADDPLDTVLSHAKAAISAMLKQRHGIHLASNPAQQVSRAT